MRGRQIIIGRLLPALAILVFSACVPAGKPPFLMVQLCLGDKGGLSEFKSVMQSIARSEGMEFIDGGEETAELRRRIDPDTTEPVIHMSVMDEEEGFGTIADNLDLPGYQVVLGFSEGAQPQEARDFARTVIDELERHWDVVLVPPGEGAGPLPNCPR